MTKDESTDSAGPSSEPKAAQKATPFQFSNKPSATATLPKDEPKDDRTADPELGAGLDSEAVVVEAPAEVEGDAEVSEPAVQADEVDAPSDPSEPDGSDEPAAAKLSAGKRLTRVGAPTWVFLALAVVALVMAFSSWRTANNDPDRDRAALRDNALIQGTADVETMTSMDHRDVAAGIKAWRSVSTGVLHDQLASIGDDEQKMLADQGKIAKGRVVGASLVDLTDRTATLIAAVEVTVKEDDPSVAPAVKRNRFSADLVLVDGRWKIENLQQVAVGM